MAGEMVAVEKVLCKVGSGISNRAQNPAPFRVLSGGNGPASWVCILLAALILLPCAGCGNTNDPAYSLAAVPQNASGNRQGVYYEVFVRSFADSDGDGIGDINGLIAKLDYLNDGNPETTTDLGITGIWLMPVNKAASYHGYDVTDYYDINPEYGTLEDFRRLVEEAHKRGISVIMDLVLNHTSDRHEWFVRSIDPSSPYRNWYHWRDGGSEGYSLDARVWGHTVWNRLNGAWYFGLFWSGMPDLNYDNPDVRKEALNIAGFWLDMGVDGFRLDAVPHIYHSYELPWGESGMEKTKDWWREFTDFCHARKPGSLVIGEVLDSNTAVRSAYLSSLDSTFHIGLGEQIAAAIKSGRSRNNYLASFIENNYRQYAAANPEYIDAPMLSNHDQDRIIGLLNGRHDYMKVAAGIYLTLEGIPFIYYGEEVGMFGSKPDEDIRLPFPWGEGDRFQTTWRESRFEKVTVTAARQQDDPESLLNHYKRLIRARNKNEALYAGRFRALVSDNEHIVAYAMESDSQSAVILHNLSEEWQDITIDLAGYTLEFCQEKNGLKKSEGMLEISPLSTVIFIKQRE